MVDHFPECRLGAHELGCARNAPAFPGRGVGVAAGRGDFLPAGLSRDRFGCTPLEYAAQLGWTGPDVWFAHGIHFDDAEIKRLGQTTTGVAHCPSSNARLGAGIARVADLRAAGCPVGLGVDGAASNEAGSLLEEVRHAVLFARARGGPQALGVRAALEMARWILSSVAESIADVESSRIKMCGSVRKARANAMR